MTTLESEAAVAMRVQVTDEAVFVELQDGRTVTAPLSWYPRLRHGTPAERGIWELVGRGSGIHWPELDEDISIASMLAGRPSAGIFTLAGRAAVKVAAVRASNIHFLKDSLA